MNNSDPEAVCQKCFGTGSEQVPGKGARLCDCRKTDAPNLLLTRAKIPDRYKDSSLTNYELEQGNFSQQAAVHHAHRLIEDYPLAERGLLLTGPTGVGKTHLAVSILKGLITKGVPSLFCETSSLLKTIQRSFSPLSQLSEMEILHPIFRAEVLLLDELGAAAPSEWVLGTLLDLINARYNDLKLTIFTSNYSDQPLGPGAQTLSDRIGVRVRSRIHEMCRTHVIEARDFRTAAAAGQRRRTFPVLTTTTAPASYPLTASSPDGGDVESIPPDSNLSH